MSDIVEGQIRSILAVELNLTPENFLFSELDSLSVIRLIVNLENKFSIKLSMADLTQDNLKNFSALCDFVKLRGSER